MIEIINGRRELGKSTLALYLTRQSSTRIIFDPRKQFHTSAVIFRSVDRQKLFDALDSSWEVIIQPDFNVVENFEATCEAIMRWLEYNPMEPLTFLVDEARFIDTPSNINPYFDWILRCTPRNLVNVIFTAHRPSDVAVDIRAIADFWFMFHITQKHDLKVIDERCGPEVCQAVANLTDGEIIVWDDSRGTARKETNRAKWFVPMSVQSIEREATTK